MGDVDWGVLLGFACSKVWLKKDKIFDAVQEGSSARGDDEGFEERGQACHGMELGCDWLRPPAISE